MIERKENQTKQERKGKARREKRRKRKKKKEGEPSVLVPKCEKGCGLGLRHD